MTIGIGVNDGNDIYIDGVGNLVMVNDLICCEQAAQQAAQAQRSEMQYHLNRGVPSMQVVWSGHPSAAQLRAAIRAELLLTTDVTGVPSLVVALEGEDAVYTADITTTFGPGVVNGTI